MGAKDDFFTKKREWSALKDRILDYYLTPYLRKILSTGYPTRIADCFAGKGMFGDGSEGSPLIIARHIDQETKRDPSVDLKGIFIERQFASDLRRNLSPYGELCVVLEGDFEDRFKHFISMRTDRDRNYFFYVDPYGIKSLSFAYFKSVKELGFRSTEVLINLNTTGFLREGLRLLKVTREVPDWACDLDYEVDRKNTPTHMTEVAGGDYWQGILHMYQDSRIDFHQAEQLLTESYRRKLSEVFRYVVDVPIKERSHHMPKYRLIFASDHQHGLLLMADEMHKAWRVLLNSETGGQLYLFEEDEMTFGKEMKVEERVWAILTAEMELRDLLCSLVLNYGIACSTSDYKTVIKKHEGALFEIVRDQPFTPTGKRATHMDQDKCRILVSRLPLTGELL